FVAVPQGAERQRRAERAWPAGQAPEALRKLEQRLGRAAVLERGDRLVLLRRQRRRDRNPPQQRRRQREHGIVSRDLRLLAPALHGDADHLATLRYRDHLGVQLQLGSERFRQRRGQRIVAALDAIHRARRRRVGVAELIDERDERELVGV